MKPNPSLVGESGHREGSLITPCPWYSSVLKGGKEPCAKKASG